MTDQHPSITTIPARSLSVDPEVQRSLNNKRVRDMAADYRPDALGVLTISARDDGSLRIIDGQHRHATVLEAGDPDRELTCQVYSGLSRSAEAAMFRHLNNTRQITPLDRFQVRVVEGETSATLLNMILVDHGWHVGQTTTSGAFRSVAALDKLYQGAAIAEPGQLIACRDTVSILTEAFGHNPDGMRAELVTGVGMVLIRHRHAADQRKLAVELARFDGGALGVIGQARTLKALRGGNIPHNLAEIVVGLHNKSRRTRTLEEWRK